MFILEVGGVGQPKSTESVDKSGEKPKTTSEQEKPKQVAQKPDSWGGTVVERVLPFPLNLMAGAAVEQQRDKYVQGDIKRRLIFDSKFSGEQLDSITKHLSNNQEAVGCRGSIRLVRASELPGGKRDEIITSFLRELELNGMNEEELKQIQKERLMQGKEAQEVERVLIATSFGVQNPVGALSSLRNLLGSLTSNFAKQLATGGISQIASYAFGWALKEAKEKGTAAFMKAITQALSGAYSLAACSNECGVEGETSIGNITPVSHTVTTTEEVYAVDENNNIIDVFYMTYEEVGCDISSKNSIDSTMAEVSGSARSGVADAEAAASRKREQIEVVTDARDTLGKLNHDEQDAKPSEIKEINITQSAEMKKIATA